MNDELKHAKVKEITPQGDGTLRIDTKSYLEKLNTHEIQTMQHFKTDSTRFMADMISCTSILKEKRVYDLDLKITLDEMGQPKLITRTFTVTKSKFNKR